MPSLTITYNTPGERRNYELAIAFVSEMHQLGLEAPPGTVIDACESLALSKGRDFRRDALAGAVQARVTQSGKKSQPSCDHRTRNKGQRSRSTITAIGKIAISRSYCVCPSCGNGEFPADATLGLDGGFTRLALKRICYVGIDNSFERGEYTLELLAGWSVHAETIRRLCHAESAECRKSKAEDLDVATSFQKASGARELQIDAGKVNTETGWRDVKVATFAVREPAEPCTSEDFGKRDLPKPSVRHVIAAIETAEEFGLRCQAEAKRIGLTDHTNLTVLGDGAEWIWNLSNQRFAYAEQNLDVYHATEYLGDLARAGFNGEAAGSKVWTDRAQVALVADGWVGVCEFVHANTAEMCNRPAFEGAYPRVANYLAGHQDRMMYAARLRRGASIGSGMIEGEIKQLVGRRMKQTGARWKTAHVSPFVELISLGTAEDWDAYWRTNAA